MLERQYWRGLYDKSRCAFVVEQAGWVEGKPNIEYRFSYNAEQDENEIACLGGIDKWWLDRNGLVQREFFAFGKYADQAAFDAAIEGILQEAQTRAHDENLDFFLAVVDIAKEYAVESELDDEILFNFEGLFEFGDEDAYSRRSYVSDRLHDHIERSKDECWRLHVVRVVSPEEHLLGWSVCAILYPTLTSEATTDQITAAGMAHILELNQFLTYGEAAMAVNGILLFMTEEGRVEEPEYAYMEDSLVLELMSVQCSVEETITPEWDLLEGDNLREFLRGNFPLKRTRTEWHPRGEDIVADVAAEMDLPLHVADQIYAQLLEVMKLSEPFDEHSPWNTITGTD